MEYQKSILNFDILCKISREQDEITNDHGQENIDIATFIDKNEIMLKNAEIDKEYAKKVYF